MQIAAANHLQEKVKKTVEGRAKLGIDAFAQALLGIPKTLAENSGYDAQEAVIKLQVVSWPANCTMLSGFQTHLPGWHSCSFRAFQCPSATEGCTTAHWPSQDPCCCHTGTHSRQLLSVLCLAFC